MFLSGLFIYPVKGCRGVELTSAQVDDLGLAGDRRYMVVQPDGKFITQRTLPRLALIEARLDPDALVLSTAGGWPVRIPFSTTSDRRLTTRVFSSPDLVVEDCGDESAEWLTEFLEQPARLVRIGSEYQRPVKPTRARPGDVVSFADAFPMLLISEASLTDLNHRMELPLPMNRFRPNLVVSGCTAFAEDGWRRFRVGSLVFRTAGPCARCTVPTVDQYTAIRAKEPLSTLATYRRNPADPNTVIFGQNLIHETKTGTLRVGDPVELI